MGEYDLVVRGGTIVDGTGVARYRSDIAVSNGRIAKISGKIPRGSAKEIDASGCIVGPGAVDLHTHYDGQLNWDPYASPGSWFGATSVLIGMCGFGFAPTRPEDRELNMRMMNRIESIPLDAMRLGMRWDWETFPEYLDSLDRQGLGLNVASQFPFSTLRGYVLGMLPARERKSVTDQELDEMKRLFHEGMEAGAFGFSSNQSGEDHPEDGGFLPSHVASPREYIGLAEVLSEFGVGLISWDVGDIPFLHSREEQFGLLAQLMRTSGRGLQALVGLQQEGRDWVEEMRAEGLPVVIQHVISSNIQVFKLAEYNLFDVYPNWVQPLVGTPPERAIKLRDPAHRAAMKKDVEESGHPRADWKTMRVVEVVHDRNRKYQGRTIEELASMQGKHPLDAFLDLALDEDLETVYQTHSAGHSVDVDRERQARLKDPYTHICVSDGGAHIKYRATGQWPIVCLAELVRDKDLLTLEEAHTQMSAFPAWIAGFKDRGTLRVGAWADMMIYDLDGLGFVYDTITYANDFPGGDRRAIQWPKGVRYVMVNGTVTFEENTCTGALPGKLMRSYDMVG